MAAASSCSDIIPWEVYDVFLSFRGVDTRKTFTCHLYRALCQKNIRTYKDDKELESGDVISPALIKAISESKLRVIIFSENYASSAWCLEELVHILQCRDKQFVIPIFYGVDPSHVRRKLGSYADAFVKHEERSPDKVEKWRDAFTTAANISGFDSQTSRDDSELVETVVNDILEKLNRESSSCLEGMVGIEKQIQQVEWLLCLHSPDVQTVGIWGMGGIGKTTIADAVFHRFSSRFDACCFIANVREKSETKHGLNDLRNQLLRTILKEENLYMASPSIGSTFARERLRRTKALVVLDDVSDLSQVEYLAGDYRNLFGPGSRIIITSRNKRMLRNGLDHGKIYKVKKLDYAEALKLFHLKANISFPGDYPTFARQVVDYAGGNPLALTLLGPVFSQCGSEEDWKDQLKYLKNFPDENIQKVLRCSYDGLQNHEKKIFLDIACYYKGEDIDYAKKMLDASGFCANVGIGLLIDASLISVDKGSRLIKMHDLIQEMGHKIVRDQGVKNLGKCSRLWIARDVCYVLQNNRGTDAIECLVMTEDPISDLDIEPSAFEKMHNLRLLRLQFQHYRDSKRFNKVHLPDGLKCLPQSLRILQLDGYPLNSLPSKFRPDNLVELHMPVNRLKRLWNKDLKINLGSLKHIDLSYSEHLAEVPDLSESPNLECINLEGCESLVQLPSYFQHRLPSLIDLHLDGCSNLKILPEMPGNLETLSLSGTAIEELPSSIWCLEKLNYLGLVVCAELKNLPSSTCRLNSLRSLDLDRCFSLESLPAELPSGLTQLDLSDCVSLGSLPAKLPSGLQTLYSSNCKSLGSLPAELPSGLEDLHLDNCKSLGSLPAELPSGLEYLHLSNCVSLGSLPVELPSGLEYLHLSNCKSLGSLPVQLPSGLTQLILRDCESLGSLPVELPSGLTQLDLSNCKSLGSLPVELPSELYTLDLSNCKSLGSLPKLPWRLYELKADGCTSLERTAQIQGWNQYVKNIVNWSFEEHIFINCVKLDQSPRSNIMADAQLRVMRIAKLGASGRVIIVCPGNKIPKWLRYQSEGCSIKNIELPPHWHREGFMGYALCIVVEFNNYTPPYIGNSVFNCETHHKTNNGHGVCREAIGIRLPDDILNLDHVFVWHFCPKFVGLEGTINHEDWVKASEASFDFMLYQSKYIGRDEGEVPLDLATVRVKRCGVSLLYAQDFEKLVGGIDEDVVMEPKQVVEEEDIIIKTKRQHLN